MKIDRHLGPELLIRFIKSALLTAYRHRNINFQRRIEIGRKIAGSR